MQVTGTLVSEPLEAKAKKELYACAASENGNKDSNDDYDHDECQAAIYFS